MSASDRCSCDDSTRWKRRALAAELSLAFTRRQLEGLLAVMPGAARVDAVGVDGVRVSIATEGAE